MPISSQVPRGDQAPGGGATSVFQLPADRVSFLKINKSRQRPTQPRRHVDRLSVFLERVAAEQGPRFEQRAARARAAAAAVVTEVVTTAFGLEPRFMRHFEAPTTTDPSGCELLETVNHEQFNCRLFLKLPDNRDNIQIITGVQDDLPPGLALCRLSDKLTPPEQMRVRHQMSSVMDELDYLSASKLYPWFSKALATAASLVAKKRSRIFDEKDEGMEDITVCFQFPQVALAITHAGETQLVNIFPAVRGHHWPRGALFQHGLPKQRRFRESGQRCLKELSQQIDDGQMLWTLDARPLRLDPSLQRQPRFRGGLRRIYGGVDRFWQVNLSPARRLVLDSAVETCGRVYEYRIRVEDVRSVLMAAAGQHGWHVVTPPLVDTVLLWCIKRSMADTRSLGRCFEEATALLHRTLLLGACPDFFLPNVNIVSGSPLSDESVATSTSADVALTASQLAMFIQSVRQEPATLLSYVGYGRNSRRSRPSTGAGHPSGRTIDTRSRTPPC